jgi:hypothetical protein
MATLAQLQYGIDQELVNEKGTSLARAGERLEAALAALVSHDGALASGSGSAQPPPAVRETLLDEAASALHALVVQRDAIGPTRHEELFQIFGVPREVIARMGVRRAALAQP